MRGSSEPRTAIHAAEGAIPSANPSTRCDHRVTLLVYEYNSSTASATGESSRVMRFNRLAARMKMALDTTTKVATNAGDRWPAGNARVLVRGFAASRAASAQRLNAIAADRAAIMATMIQAS